MAIVAVSSILFAGTTYLIGKRWEDQKRFLTNFRPPNDFEAHLAYTIDYAVNSSEKNDVIFIGDSTCLTAVQTVQFERLTSLKAYNLGCVGILGIDGCDLLFRSYLAHHPKPRLLVFSGHPVSLVARPTDLGPFEVREVRERLLWSLDPEPAAARPPHDDAVLYFVRQGFHIIVGHLTGGFARYAAEPIPLRGGDTFVSLVKELRENRGYWAHPGILDPAMRRKGCGLEWVDRRLNVSPEDPFPVSEENRDWFRTLARYAREQEIALLVHLTPVLLSESPEHYDSIHAWTTELEREFPGVIISRPEVIQYEPADFGEKNHLNPRGAEKFTALAAQEVMRVWPTANASTAHDRSGGDD